jgi:hypothetical protein
MLLNDILECGLIEDDDRITVSVPFSGPVRVIKSGHWFDDHILDYTNHKITEFSWSPASGWRVMLEPVPVEADQMHNEEEEE